MTRNKWLKLLKSGSLLGLVANLATTGLALADKLPPKTGLVVMVFCSMLMAISQSLPQLILDIIDEGTDVNVGKGGPAVS